MSAHVQRAFDDAGYWPCDNPTVRKDDAAALGLELGEGAHPGRAAAGACGDGAAGRYSSTGPTREHHRTTGAGPQRSVSDDAKTDTAPVLMITTGVESRHDYQREPFVPLLHRHRRVAPRPACPDRDFAGALLDPPQGWLRQHF